MVTWWISKIFFLKMLMYLFDFCLFCFVQLVFLCVWLYVCVHVAAHFSELEDAVDLK